MNIIDALRRSKETGERFKREKTGEIYYASARTHLFLEADDVLADDWEPVEGTGDLAKIMEAKDGEMVACAFDPTLPERLQQHAAARRLLDDSHRPDEPEPTTRKYLLAECNGRCIVQEYRSPEQAAAFIKTWPNGEIVEFPVPIVASKLKSADPQPDIVIEGD